MCEGIGFSLLLNCGFEALRGWAALSLFEVEVEGANAAEFSVEISVNFFFGGFESWNLFFEFYAFGTLLKILFLGFSRIS